MIEYKIGDCLELMKDIPDNSIDLILCDLPYGTTRNKWDSIIDLDELWHQYKRITKDNSAIVLTAQTPFDKILGASNLKMLKYEWIWNKNIPTGFLNAKKMPLKEHENILVFYKNLPTYNPQGIIHNPKIQKRGSVGSNYGFANNYNISEYTNYPKSIINIPSDKEKYHPTQKPLELFKYLIKTYTNENDTVLDNCLGSGTTLIACKELNRNGIGFEINQEYEPIIKKRLEKYK